MMTAKPNPADDPVFAKYGAPFITNNKGQVRLNEVAVAVKCATVNLVKYDPGIKRYERYNESTGLWATIHEVAVHRLLGDLLLALGQEWHQQEFVRLIKTSQLSSLAKMLQPYQADVQTLDTAGLIHVANGVLDLRGAKPKLLPHDPKFPLRHSSGIRYDPKAKCPRFENDLLKPAMSAPDIRLTQNYVGSALGGVNSSQTMLLIEGETGGNGKSTTVATLEMVVGEDKVAELKTKHLNGRFETSAFIGKRLLIGKDVPGDTLTQKGAHQLKSLVGGDLLQAEIKYNAAKQQIRGDYHVVIVSNNNLRIALDGDEGAWQRRLLVVRYDGPRPKKPIHNFAEKLVAEEGSGILNWLIKGAYAYRAEMAKRGRFALTEEQEQRIAMLLHDSDSVLSFVEQRVTRRSGADVSSEELLLSYYDLCKQQGWTPVSGHSFQVRIPDLICEQFQICRRNDIRREGTTVRGYKGLALN